MVFLVFWGRVRFCIFSCEVSGFSMCSFSGVLGTCEVFAFFHVRFQVFPCVVFLVFWGRVRFCIFSCEVSGFSMCGFSSVLGTCEVLRHGMCLFFS